MKKSSKFVKFLAWFLSIFSGVFLFLAILVFIEGKDKGALFGMLMFAAFFGFPGFILLFKYNHNDKKYLMFLQVKGYINTRNKFLLKDFANNIHKSEAESALLIFELNEIDENIDLVFHKPSGYFYHRNLMDTNFHEIKNCKSCGATLKAQVIFKGEKIICEYCANVIEV